MNKYVSRLYYLRPGEPHNPLMWPFLIITIALGIAFTFFTGTEPVQASVLYKLTIAHLPDVTASVWGIAALCVSGLQIASNMLRKQWLGRFQTWAGTLLWLYAVMLYGIYGFWLQLFTSGLPNLVFWIWYFFYVRRYYDIV